LNKTERKEKVRTHDRKATPNRLWEERCKPKKMKQLCRKNPVSEEESQKKRKWGEWDTDRPVSKEQRKYQGPVQRLSHFQEVGNAKKDHG